MEKSIGALWVATSQKGEYWKGYVELEEGKRQNVIIFRNTYKKDNQPDLRIFKQKQKEQKEDFTPNDEPIMSDDERFTFLGVK